MAGNLGKIREKISAELSELNDSIREETPRIGWKYLALLAVLGIPAFFLTRYFIAFGLMILTLLVSLVINSYDANRLGIETATFSTVTMGLVFPAEIGAILGLIYVSLQIFSGSNPGIYMLWVVPSYVVLGYFIGNFSNLNPAMTGMYASLTLQSFFVIMTFLTSRSRLPKFIQYVVFNLTFNFFMFKTFAQPLMGVIGQ